MAVIAPQDYLAIATDYANARTSVLGSVQYLFDAVYEVVILNSIQPEVDLLNEFYNSYLVNTNQYSTPVTFLSAVRALNNHVLNRGDGSYTTISEYITEQVPGGKVPAAWADLCTSAGFPVGCALTNEGC